MAVVSISIPDELLRQAEDVLARRGFAGRSELARAALREFIAGHDEDGSPGRRSATLTVVYPHGHERAFSAMRHAHQDVIRTTLHTHAADGETCIELFVLEGEGARIQKFHDMLRAAPETLRARLVYTDMARRM